MWKYRSSGVVLDQAAVVGLLVEVSVPEHDAAVVVLLLRHRRDAVVDVLGVYPLVGLVVRREPDVEPGGRVRRRPLVPRALPPKVLVAPLVALVGPHVDALEDPRRQRPPHVRRRRVPAPDRRRQVQRLPRPPADVVLGQLQRQHVVAVRRRAVLQEEVDAVEPRVAEGAGDARLGLAEVGVPQVVEEVERGAVGRQRVAGVVAADGEGDGHALELAVLDVGADGGEVVAGEVEVVLAVGAEDVEEGHGDHGVHAGVAGLTQGPLRLVPSPEHRHLAGLSPRRQGRRGQE